MKNKNRYTILDALRGITIISMVLYHAVWDLLYMFDIPMEWYKTDMAYYWQQSILWTFLLLSGFCWSMGKKKLKRALTVLAGSVIITAVTALFIPEGFIIFGVLSLIGTGMLITIPLDKFFQKIPAGLGLVICCVFFTFTRNVGIGEISIGSWELLQLPAGWYVNDVTAYLGFPSTAFVSQDYVPVIPWIFMYWAGYFLYQIFLRKDWLKHLSAFSVKPLEWLGRHSLEIYMVHQPVVYGVLFLITSIL